MEPEAEKKGAGRPPKEQEKATVEVEKAVLDNLLSRLSILEESNAVYQKKEGLFAKEGDIREAQAQAPRIRTATLRKYRTTSDDPYMLAIDLKLYRTEWDAVKREMQQIYRITWRLPDGKTKETMMPIQQFAQINDREEVTILENKVKKMEKITGFTIQRTVSEDYTVKKGDRVPCKETWEETTCLIQLSDGTKFEIPANRLNM